jgi:hypothetical protein
MADNDAKIYNPNTSQWELVDFLNFDSVDLTHVKNVNGILQFSTDEVTWYSVM